MIAACKETHRSSSMTRFRGRQPPATVLCSFHKSRSDFVITTAPKTLSQLLFILSLQQ